VSDARITHDSVSDAMPESELDVLAAVYRFILDCHASRKAADATGDRNEVKEVQDIDPTRSLPESRGKPTGYP
jgi:hypothetical protein